MTRQQVLMVAKQKLEAQLEAAGRFNDAIERAKRGEEPLDDLVKAAKAWANAEIDLATALAEARHARFADA